MAIAALNPDSGPAAVVTRVIREVGRVVLGKHEQVKLALACLLARGHLLIEDMPGVGKTTLAHALAAVTGLQFQRIQFTSDLLPADVLGASVYDRESGGFSFHPGPVFSQLILADEINRATPKTQSALLEAMEEAQVTVEGETRHLPHPFFVIATQNPVQQVGTFPLPESQLDRFLMRLELGYPDHGAERELLAGRDRRELLEHITPILEHRMLETLQRSVTDVHVSDRLLDYVQAILEHTRTPGRYHTGLSPRAGLALLRGAQAWAFMHARDYVAPDDVQGVLGPVIGHRLQPLEDHQGDSGHVRQLIDAIPLP